MHTKPKTLFWAWKSAFQPLQGTFHEKNDRNSPDFEKIIAHGQIFSIDLPVGGQKYRRAFTLFQFHTWFQAKIGYFFLNECHFGYTTKKLAKSGQINGTWFLYQPGEKNILVKWYSILGTSLYCSLKYSYQCHVWTKMHWSKCTYESIMNFEAPQTLTYST
jgi:hypothetical protein